jgi:pimeloyl-ACP methyl ester carboxylesterase/DNA-binding winged helix-turn-helix (wHTH) protein
VPGTFCTMIYRFDTFELDLAARQLRRSGQPLPLQPKAFDVLAYLVRHRDRVVPKQELLDELWPGVTVTDASVQRAISLARAAIDDRGRTLRTMPRVGYRFVAPVDAPASAVSPSVFQPRFALSDGLHIAYHVIGAGHRDLVLIGGWVFPMRAYFDHQDTTRWIEALARDYRVILFDKRGTGLSDPVKRLPTLPERGDDLRAVLDAVGAGAPVVAGLSEGGILAAYYAASFPERTRGLLIAGSFARWAATPDYVPGWPAERFDELRQYIATRWGEGETIKATVESRAGDPEIARWAARAEQEGASPGAASDLLAMNLQLDVRPLLPSVRVPTVVLHHVRDALFPLAHARYLASHVPGARLVEADGGDHSFLFEGGRSFRDAVAWLFAQPRGRTGRFLATVVAVAAPAHSTRQIADLAARHGGVRADPAGLVWRFDGPQRAIQSAHVLVKTVRLSHGQVRAGVHAGEVGSEKGRLVGDGVDAARALAAEAPPGEVWISSVVRDLLHGAALRFLDRRSVRLHDGREIAALAADTAR